ncbi:cobyric acid synthase [Muricomes intestini]|uniref:Cobyric acid synthase n=1 Tax=Muricomes intestini TaxID=1796634 RepID=A0A4R3K6K6_9FIRM|nr:cobyric acid synthase [Muricomes intestini]TCS78331.1 adenosylcobyric acid synthase (glutamine-hydrolysing) [Muricomes intestini]
MAKVIMIQGTMSNAGKSILVGGLCRAFHQDGFRTAPFKSQNMALNSFITDEGLEMGRAQVMQAEAAGISPSVSMNPILLKPTNDTGSQVILNGEVKGVMSAAEYYRHKKEYIPAILEAFHRLERNYDIIVIEGAGSPAEINLKKDDIVNMGLAALVNAPVLLVGDIDRGGVFAQLVGTMALLEEEEKSRVKGVIINKFRGDKEILRPGLRMLEDKIHVPVTGVVPYFYLDIDDEDSLTERFDRKETKGILDVAVIRTPRISNFTDFMALECMEGITLRYVLRPGEFGNPDGVIIPGSKNTMEDLLWMRQIGLEAQVVRHSKAGKLVFGICGGYQMLGDTITDPEGVEHKGKIKGMGLLPMHTVFQPQKTRTRVTGKFQNLTGDLSLFSQIEIEGYEIHMGTTEFTGKEEHILVLQEDTQKETLKFDGAAKESVMGCYVHGVFDRPEVAGAFVQVLLKQKGIAQDAVSPVDLSKYKEEQYDKLADVIRENLDMAAVYEILEKGNRV